MCLGHFLPSFPPSVVGVKAFPSPFLSLFVRCITSSDDHREREREREREAVWIRSDKKERTTRLCPQDGEGPFRSSRSFVSSGNFAQALKVQPQKVGAQKGFCSTEVKINMILTTLLMKTDNIRYLMKRNALGYFFPVRRASGGELIDNAICLQLKGAALIKRAREMYPLSSHCFGVNDAV